MHLFLTVPGLHCGTRAVCAACGLSLVEARELLSVVVRGLWACRLQELQHGDSVVAAHGLRCSAACVIFWLRDRTHVPCTARQILNHWTAKEALFLIFY